jgi:hypothetical protein
LIGFLAWLHVHMNQRLRQKYCLWFDLGACFMKCSCA